MMRRLFLPTAAVAALLLLSGCSASMQAADMAEGYSGGSAPQISEERLVTDPELTDAEGRQVVVTGTMWVTVESPRESADEVTRIVEGAGGHVDNRSERAPRDRDPGRAELTVRIPSVALSATLDAIEELGDVEETSTHRKDVTSVAKDLDARITALEASVDRLLALMAQAQDTDDLIAIESTLSQRQSDLESLQAQRRSLADQVDYSTITIHLGSEADAPIDDPDTFVTGLVTGWEALVAFVSFLLVALGVVLPWLILPAIALGILLLVLRHRRRSQPAAEPAGEPAETS